MWRVRVIDENQEITPCSGWVSGVSASSCRTLGERARTIWSIFCQNNKPGNSKPGRRPGPRKGKDDPSNRPCRHPSQGRADLRTHGRSLVAAMRARDASTRNDRVERNLLRPLTGFNGQRRANELLRDIARGLSGSSGEHYFHALTRYLVQSLRMDYAFIGELTGEDRQSIVALSFCAHDRIRDNFRYDLRHTPCRDVLHDGPCTYPSEVRN